MLIRVRNAYHSRYHRPTLKHSSITLHDHNGRLRHTMRIALLLCNGNINNTSLLQLFNKLISCIDQCLSSIPCLISRGGKEGFLFRCYDEGCSFCIVYTGSETLKSSQISVTEWTPVTSKN